MRSNLIDSWVAFYLRWFQILERLRRILFANGGDLGLELLLESLEHLRERVSDGLDNLMVVVFDGHLEIEAYELGQVTMCVRVFSSEYYNKTMFLISFSLFNWTFAI